MRGRIRDRDIWRGQARIMVEVGACPLRQLQKTHGGVGCFRIYRPSSMPSFGLGRCDRRHKLLFKYPIIFWTEAAPHRKPEAAHDLAAELFCPKYPATHASGWSAGSYSALNQHPMHL
jgi:hypothetical protein